MAATWSFEASFSPTRRAKLEAVVAFEDIIEALLALSKVADAWVREGTELGPKGCYRPSVQLDVPSDLFDAFFNSPRGYRALFLADPDEGQAGNGKLLRALEPKLTAAVAERCGESKPSRASLRNAFLACSAKIWPDEDNLDFREATQDIAVPHWHACDWLNAPAGAGLWAPEGTKLKAIGAFIDQWATRWFLAKRCGGGLTSMSAGSLEKASQHCVVDRRLSLRATRFARRGKTRTLNGCFYGCAKTATGRSETS